MTATVSASELSRHLDVSREQIRRLIAQGVLQHAPDGRFNIDACRIAYIRHLRAKPVEANKLIEARVRLAELRAQRLRESMMDVPAALAFLAEIIGPFVSGLSGVPAEFCGRDLQARRRLQAIIDRHRNEFADLIERKMAELKKQDAA